MVFFNYATMQMAAKIVYYGPGLCGKTTNLHHIYAKTSPQSRGEMVSLETESDRTLFFDLLPIDVGIIAGFKTRLQLYTVPGQVFYNTTRKLVLKGVDGIVFVADSQAPMLDANIDAFSNLRENLAELGLKAEDVPIVIQLNKRDLPNALSVDTILNELDPERKHAHMEAVAAAGAGVFETLKLISKLTLRTLRTRMTGDEAAKAGGGTGKIGAVRVRNTGAEALTAVATNTPIKGTPPVAPKTAPAPATTTAPRAAPPHPAPFAESALAKSAAVDPRIIAEAPVKRNRVTEPITALTAPPPPPPPPLSAPFPEPEIDFSQTEKPAKAAEVKHVKMRSTVDVMAELEALRKRATTGTTPKKKDPNQPKRDVQKAVGMKVPADVLAQAKSMRVTVSFETSDGVVQTQERSVDLSDASDADSLTVNLRIDS